MFLTICFFQILPNKTVALKIKRLPPRGVQIKRLLGLGGAKENDSFRQGGALKNDYYLVNF